MTQWPWRPHDVVLGNQNDAKPMALARVLDQHADIIIVRFGWNAVREGIKLRKSR